MIGAGVAPDIGLAQRAGLEIGERGGVRCTFAAGELGEGRVRGGGHLRIRLADARRARADRALGRGVQPGQDGGAEHARAGTWRTKWCRTSTRCWGIGANSSTSGRRGSGTRRSCAGSYEEGKFTTWYLKDGRVKAALTWGSSDDLEHARRLIAGAETLDETQRSMLADADSDLGDVG